MANYNSVPIDNNLANMLKTGKPIGDLSHINHQLETSRAPIETMIATLELAIKNVGSGDLPDDLVTREENVIRSCERLFSYTGDTGYPDYVPSYLGDEAVRRFNDNGRPLYDYSISDRRGEVISDAKTNLYSTVEEVQPAIDWRNTHEVHSDQFNREYREGLSADYNAYSKALNTSKMLTQPTWAYGKSKAEIQEVFSHMDNVELLSMYDDLTISEDEIDRNINDLNGFTYIRRHDISEKANDNIDAWYERNRVLASRVRERRTENLYLSFFVAQELSRRDVKYASN